jgi:hypothetical protein
VQILFFLSKEIQKASFEANIEIEFYFSPEKQSATCVLSHLNIFGSKLLSDFQFSKTFFVPAKNIFLLIFISSIKLIVKKGHLTHIKLP